MIANPTPSPADALTSAQVQQILDSVSGAGIAAQRAAVRARFDSALQSKIVPMAYAGTCTVTAAGASSSLSALAAASTGTALNTAIYDLPSPVATPRSGATAYMEPRGVHTTADLTLSAGRVRGRWRIVTDAPIFEVQRYGLSNSGYALLVDGTLVSEVASAANDGAAKYDKFDFSAESNARRRKLVEIYGDASFAFAGLRISGNDSVWKPSPLPKTLILGDSYSAGGGNGLADWSSGMARALGLHDYKSGVGSTGYLATNGGAAATFRQRFTVDVAAYQPDIVVIAGGVNDIPGYLTNSWTYDQLGAEALALYQTALAQCPNAEIVVLGPWRGSSGNAGSFTAAQMDTTFFTAAQASGAYGTRLWYIPTINDTAGPWQFGSSASGNNQVYDSGDGTHPNVAGARYLSGRAVDGWLRALP